MGITGLLPLMRRHDLLQVVDIGIMSKKKVAVDGYVWLHNAAAANPAKTLNSKDHKHIVTHFMRGVTVMLEKKVIPVVVFDGAPFPAKGITEKARKKKREDAAKNVQAMASEATTNTEAYRKECQKAIDVTPEMAASVCVELKRRNVEFMVAPYEADAQLAYLCDIGYVGAVVTVDSDMIPYGCPKVFFKMDKKTGGCEYFDRSRMAKVNPDCKASRLSNSYLESGATGVQHNKLLLACIISGCDYLKSPPNLGLSKALDLTLKAKTMAGLLKSVTRNYTVIAKEYKSGFAMALATFMHQVVYNPITKKTVRRTPSNLALDGFAGKLLSDDEAQAVAEGLIDPVTKNSFSRRILQSNYQVTMASTYKTIQARRASLATCEHPLSSNTRPIMETMKGLVVVRRSSEARRSSSRFTLSSSLPPSPGGEIPLPKRPPPLQPSIPTEGDVERSRSLPAGPGGPYFSSQGAVSGSLPRVLHSPSSSSPRRLTHSSMSLPPPFTVVEEDSSYGAGPPPEGPISGMGMGISTPQEMEPPHTAAPPLPVAVGRGKDEGIKLAMKSLRNVKVQGQRPLTSSSSRVPKAAIVTKLPRARGTSRFFRSRARARRAASGSSRDSAPIAAPQLSSSHARSPVYQSHQPIRHHIRGCIPQIVDMEAMVSTEVISGFSDDDDEF